MRWPWCCVCDEVYKSLVKDTDLRDKSWRRSLPRLKDMSLEYDEMEMADELKPCK